MAHRDQLVLLDRKDCGKYISEDVQALSADRSGSGAVGPSGLTGPMGTPGVWPLPTRQELVVRG